MSRPIKLNGLPISRSFPSSVLCQRTQLAESLLLALASLPELSASLSRSQMACPHSRGRDSYLNVWPHSLQCSCPEAHSLQ